MSPEQLAGKKVDGHSDLFSAGVMLYQMLSGSLPYKADLMTRLMYNITSEEVANVRTICAGILEAQAAIINKAILNYIALWYRGGTNFTAALKDFLKA